MSVVAGPSPPRSTPESEQQARPSSASVADAVERPWPSTDSVPCTAARPTLGSLGIGSKKVERAHGDHWLSKRHLSISPQVSQWTETWPSLSAVHSMESSHWHKPGVLVRSQDDVSGAGKASSFLMVHRNSNLWNSCLQQVCWKFVRSLEIHACGFVLEMLETKDYKSLGVIYQLFPMKW